MKIFAYIYSNPLLETAPDIENWGLEIERIYQDFADSSNSRLQLQKLLEDCRKETPDYLIIRRLNELGNNIENIADNLAKLETMGITPVTLEQGCNSLEKISKTISHHTAYRNSEIICNTHTAIISKEEAAQVDRLLRRNSRLPSRTASAPRSLAGLVKCKNCQSPMTISRVTIRNKKKEYLYLRPINCSENPKCKGISYKDVLEATVKIICDNLVKAVEEINFPQLDLVKKNIHTSIERQNQILEQIPSLVETEILDTQTAKLRAYKLRTQISELEAKLATLPPVNLKSVAKLVSIPQFWLDLSESERRFYLREFIQEIEIIRDGKDWRIEVVFIF